MTPALASGLDTWSHSLPQFACSRLASSAEGCMQVLQYGYPRSANRFDSLKLSRCGQVPRGQDKGELSMRR